MSDSDPSTDNGNLGSNGEQPAPAPPPAMSPPPEFVSNYPRSAAWAKGYVRPPGVYWDTVSTAFSMITSQWQTYVASTLIAILLIVSAYVPLMLVLVGSLVNRAPGAPGIPGASVASVIPQLFLQFVSVFVLFCLISVGVGHIASGTAQISDFFIPFRRLGKSCLATLLASAPAMLMQLLVLIPTLLIKGAKGAPFSDAVPIFAAFGIIYLLGFIYYFFCYGPMLLAGTASIFGDPNAIERLKDVIRLLRWNCLLFGLLTVCAGTLSGLGMLACCVGVLFTYPILPNVIALHQSYCFPTKLPESA